MDVCVYVERKEEKYRAQKIMGTGTCQLGDCDGTLRWFRYVECKDDADWAKQYMSTGD